MKLCAACGQPLSDPPNGGKCDPAAMRSLEQPDERAIVPTITTDSVKPAFWYHAPGPAWSPNG